MPIVPLFSLAGGEVIGRIVGSETLAPWTSTKKKEEYAFTGFLEGITRNLAAEEVDGRAGMSTDTAAFAMLGRDPSSLLRVMQVLAVDNKPHIVNMSVFSFIAHATYGTDIQSDEMVDRSLRSFVFLVARFGLHILLDMTPVGLGPEFTRVVDAARGGTLGDFLREEEEWLGVKYLVDTSALELSGLLQSPLPIFEPTRVFREWADASCFAPGTR